MKKVRVDNPRYPHQIRIVRTLASDWLSDSSSSDESELTIYNGFGRSYTETTTTGDKKVDTNRRKASIPVRFDEWPTVNQDNPDATLVPMSGDLLYVTKCNITEEWEVKDFEPDNNRSVIYGEFNRNFNISGNVED